MRTSTQTTPPSTYRAPGGAALVRERRLPGQSGAGPGTGAVVDATRGDAGTRREHAAQPGRSHACAVLTSSIDVCPACMVGPRIGPKPARGRRVRG